MRTNFRMPDVLSIGLGGGSIVRVGSGGEVGTTVLWYQQLAIDHTNDYTF